jgi:hypothetical protein
MLLLPLIPRGPARLNDLGETSDLVKETCPTPSHSAGDGCPVAIRTRPEPIGGRVAPPKRGRHQRQIAGDTTRSQRGVCPGGAVSQSEGVGGRSCRLCSGRSMYSRPTASNPCRKRLRSFLLVLLVSGRYSRSSPLNQSIGQISALLLFAGWGRGGETQSTPARPHAVVEPWPTLLAVRPMAMRPQATSRAVINPPQTPVTRHTFAKEPRWP